MSQFRNSLMLYRPTFSCWTARKKDKDQSEKANRDAGAVEGAANVHKALLPDNPELLAVQKWVTAMRTWIYNVTLPWDDNGGRVARVERHMDFMAEAGDRITKGHELVEAFLNSYAAAIEQARFKLVGMFNALDYPSVDEVRRKFYFAVECDAVPDAADFRIIDGLPPEEVERLVRDAQQGAEKRIGAAMADAHERLFDVVSKMATTLQQYGDKGIRKFNDTLVSNIADVAAIIPALNLTNDPKLTKLAADAARLATYDLKDLRGMPEVRDAAIAEARALASRFEGFSMQDVVAPPKPAVTPKPMEQVIADGAVFPAHGYDASPSSSEPHVVETEVDPASLATGWGE